VGLHGRVLEEVNGIGDPPVSQVAMGVAGRRQDVVDPDRVLDQLNDLPTAIREERLPFLDAPGRQTSPRVARAEKLGQVGPVERDEVPDLLPERLRDGDRWPARIGQRRA